MLTALTLITVDARSNGTGVLSDTRSKVDDVFSPLQRATHAVLQPIGNFLTGAADYGSVRKENQKLRNQLATLQAQSVQAGAEQAAAEQVLAEQNLPFLGGIPTVTVEVIDNGYSNFETAITIDKGTSSGIAPGQPVVAAGGLVGTVESAGSDVATVVLLTDPTFAVGVRLPGGNIGTAQGVGLDQPLRVTVDTTNDQTPPKMTKGQTVVTSGLDTEKFPGNIPVGKVASVTRVAGESEPQITLSPLVNLDQLNYLDVELWAPS